ncbi:MAG: hypothetical protein CVU89_14185 [Firmicutes bacterium HGW-Firmicutes-14]|nr:MAG: hypothetical protein CVU89_14185 [Firmicutes bacterium HGW-Firmicutes-14]
MKTGNLAKLALGLMLALLFGILTDFYIFPGKNQARLFFRSGLMVALLFGLAASLLACNLTRVSVMSRQAKITGSNTAKRGSVIFHLGLVLILFGFGISALFGMKGRVMIPEGVAVRFPSEISSVETGKLHSFEEYTVGLNEMELVREGENIGQVRSHVDFITNGQSGRRVIEINRPAKFRGYYWRSMNWGYSVHLIIKSEDMTVLDNFLNIATHRDGLYYDRYSVPDLGEFQVRFYANMPVQGKPAEKAVFPDRPAVEIKLLSSDTSGAEPGGPIIPLGQTGKLGNYTVSFSEHRFWEEFDVSSDPGESFIFLGSILAVAGLFLRVVFRG